MANYKLTVEERTQTGKSYARKLRTKGKIPQLSMALEKSPPLLKWTFVRWRGRYASGSLIDLTWQGQRELF